MKATEKQIDNLVSLLDGYIEKRGHHLNVNVFSKETLLDAQAHPAESPWRRRCHSEPVRTLAWESVL